MNTFLAFVTNPTAGKSAGNTENYENYENYEDYEDLSCG